MTLKDHKMTKPRIVLLFLGPLTTSLLIHRPLWPKKEWLVYSEHLVSPFYLYFDLFSKFFKKKHYLFFLQTKRHLIKRHRHKPVSLILAQNVDISKLQCHKMTGNKTSVLTTPSLQKICDSV